MAMISAKWKNIQIRYKMMLVTSFVMTITIFIICFTVYLSSSVALKENSDLSEQVILHQIMSNFSMAQKQIEDSLHLQYNTTSYYPVFDTNNRQADIKQKEYYYQDALWNLTYSNSYVNAVLIVDTSGVIWSMSKGQNDVDYLKECISSDDNEKVLALHGKCIFEGYDENTIIVKRTLYDIKTTKYVGYMIASIKASYFNKIFAGIQSEEKEYIIFNENGNALCVSTNNIKVAFKNNDDFEILTPIESGEHIFNSQEYIVSNFTNNKSNWQALSIIPRESVVKSSRILLFTIIAIGILTLLIALQIINIFFYGIGSRLNSLLDAEKQVADGNLMEKILVDSSDEIGKLAKQFNIMLKKIRDLMSEIAIKEKQRRDIEILKIEFHYNALQSQLNPHFLYNSLESINCLAKIHGEKEISDMICTLGRLLRVAVNNNIRMVTLSKEIEFIRDYLKLFKWTNQNKIILFTDISEDVEAIEIPKLLLQPIVENSIIHGFADKKNSGIIEIDAFKDSEMLYISVSDNGAGINMSSDQLNNLLVEKESSDRRNENVFHVGLNSVYSRLKLFYGEQSDMSISTSSESGTVVSIKIPCSWGSENNAI